MGMFWTIVNHLRSLTGPRLMLLYPLYASVKSIEIPSKVDDEQWITYWILYSFLTLVETAATTLISWIPFWHHIKLDFIAWLVLPQFRGASLIYQRFVREQLIKYRQWVEKDKLGSGGNENQRMFLQDIQSPKEKSTVEHFISENGQDAFDIIFEVVSNYE